MFCTENSLCLFILWLHLPYFHIFQLSHPLRTSIMSYPFSRPRTRLLWSHHEPRKRAHYCTQSQSARNNTEFIPPVTFIKIHLVEQETKAAYRTFCMPPFTLKLFVSNQRLALTCVQRRFTITGYCFCKSVSEETVTVKLYVERHDCTALITNTTIILINLIKINVQWSILKYFVAGALYKHILCVHILFCTFTVKHYDK